MCQNAARGLTAAAIIALGLSACKTGDVPTNPGDQPPITTPLTCTQNGVAGPCTLPLDVALRSFDIVLTSKSCDARGNRLRVTSPVQSELTADACYENIGKKWTFNGPYAAGSVIDVAIISAPLPGPSALRATGQFPQWLLEFEDGGDTDFNDVVLTVTAHQ